MEDIILNYQNGNLNKDELFFKLNEFFIVKNSSNLLINIIASILKDYNLREQNIYDIFNLLMEFIFKFKINKKEHVNNLNLKKTIIEKLLLEGLTIKELNIRINCLIGVNILLKIINIQEYYIELELDKDYLAKCLFKISLKDKSFISKKIAISNLGLFKEGKSYLFEIMINSNNYIDRMRALNNICINEMNEYDIMNYFSRMLDENNKIRKLFYKTLSKNIELFIKLTSNYISWSHFMIICQFGLNDRNINVKNSCINFIIDFISKKYGENSFNGKIFILLIDDILNSLSNKEFIDITAANIEVIIELLIPNLINYLNYNINIFFKEIMNLTNEEILKDNNIFLTLKSSQILVIRIIFENYKDLNTIQEYDCFNIENMIFSLSINSNNSFLIRQILLIINYLDKSDPEIKKMIKSLTINCLKYTPFDDSLELLETEFIPLESLIKSSNGGEWIAYFLHRSVIYISIKILKEECLDLHEFLLIIKKIINEIINPIDEEEKKIDIELEIYKINDLIKYLDSKNNINKHQSNNYESLYEIIEVKFMRILFILESFLSIIDTLKNEDIIYFTDEILKPCTYFFVNYSKNEEIPQILLVRCTTLITIIKERSLLTNNIIDKENDNLLFFIQGLDNKLKYLKSKINKSIIDESIIIYNIIQCEVYICSIIDILMIRQMKDKHFENDLNLIYALNIIWKMSNGLNFSTYRLTSISLRGISRILLCLKINNYNIDISINILICLLYLTYFTNTYNEFNILIEPQKINNINNIQDFKKIKCISDIFSINELLNFKNNIYISSGDKQMLIYLFSTYITLSIQHLKCFTISVYTIIEIMCKNTGIIKWNSYSKNINKLILFSILQLKQANDYFKNIEINSIKSYSNLYGILSLYLISIKFPKYIKKIHLKKRMTQLLEYLFLDIKNLNKETSIEWIITNNLINDKIFIQYVDNNILNNNIEYFKNIDLKNIINNSINDNEIKELYLNLLKIKKGNNLDNNNNENIEINNENINNNNGIK